MALFKKSIALEKVAALAKLAQPKPPLEPPPPALLKAKEEFAAERRTNFAGQDPVFRAVVGAADALDEAEAVRYGRNEPGQSSKARFIPRRVAESSSFQGTAVPQARIKISSKARASSTILPKPKKKRMKLRPKAIY